MQDTLGRARAWLADARNPDGSWGYLPARGGRPEPTLLAALAGQDPSLRWLSRQDLGWSRRLAPLALHGLAGAEDLVRNALDAMEADVAAHVPGLLGFDTSIPAWGWVSGTSAWVEPTATAVLALRRGGRESSPRVADGVRMLLDRQCRDGGWNCGNPTMLGTDQESYPETTAWALLALQGWPSVEPVVEKGFAWLATTPPTSLGRSLTALAADAHRRDPEDALGDLVRLQGPDGSWQGRVDLTALATAALGILEGRHALRL